MSKLGDEPAYPYSALTPDRMPTIYDDQKGLTKRERACIDLRIPESGNAELDVLIAKAQRRDLTATASQGILGSRNGFLVDVGVENCPDWAVQAADCLLAKLAKENDDG